MTKSNFIIEGMRCAACSSGVERNLKKIDGVIEANVNLLTKKLDISFDESKISAKDIINSINKSGFSASLEITKASIEQMKPEKKQKSNNEFKMLVISLFLSAVLMVISMGQMLFPSIKYPEIISITHNPYNFALIQFIITIIVLTINKRFFTSGISAILRLNPNMDSLVAISASASLIFSLAMTFNIYNNSHAVHNLYFESACMVTALVSLGKYLESKNTQKTNEQITALMQLTPDSANLITDKGAVETPTSEINVGQIIQVETGSKIALDGIIISGDAEVDESMITGESIPVFKQKGDKVVGGTILVSGLILVEVTHTGKDTVVSKIVKFVEDAQSKKAPISKIADKVAAIFVPSVILISTIAAAVWLILGADIAFALKIFTSVLVIACPCAMGLATPTAIIVSTGRGAFEGILIRNGEALQKLSTTDLVIFDKTGTITTGKPEITDYTNIQTLAGAYILSNFSTHPLSESICLKAKEKKLESTLVPMESLIEFQNIPGMGLTAILDNHRLLSGNKKLMNKFNVDTSKFDSQIESLQSEGKSIVIFAALPLNDPESADIGIIALADKIRPEAKTAIKKIHSMGIETMLLTGDNSSTAKYIADKSGITKFRSELMPNDKFNIIKETNTIYQTLMVGDGINDAPALAIANSSCAIGSGSDIAIESAELILMHNKLDEIPKAINLSKNTIKIIKQNLFWAFCYNVLAIPVAAGLLWNSFGILLSPMIGAIAMSLSSIFVVTNSLRLKKIKIN